MAIGRNHFKQIYEHEMRHGSIDLGIDKVVMFGIAGSGKTCSLAAILGLPPPDIRCSTPLMERPIDVKVVFVDDKQHWQKMTPEQVHERIATIIKSRAKPREQIREMIATIIRSRGESPSVVAQNSPNSGHTIHQHSTPTAIQPDSPSKKDASETVSISNERKVKPTTQPHVKNFDSLVESSAELDAKFVEQINNSTSSSEPILKENWLYVIDSGGQHEFHEVLPIFLNGATKFIFVFKIHESLDKRPDISYYDSSGKMVGEPYQSFLTNKEIFKHCMRTIYSFASKNKDCNRPQILVLGTHRDMVKEENLSTVLEYLNNSLKEVLMPHLRDQIIFCDEIMESLVFSINAQQPGEEDRTCAEAIRAFLGKKHGRRRVQMPLRWHFLDDKLRLIAKEMERKVLSRHECQKIAQSLGIDDESCEEALNFFNDLNLLFYYPRILPDLLFLEPQVILDKVSELVRKSHQMRQKSNHIRPTGGEWHTFRDYGEVTEMFLKEFGKHYEEPLFTAKELIALFKHLLVFAELSTNRWFMPSLLEVVSEDVTQYQVSREKALVIHFPDGGPQSGMFCCLIAFILSIKKSGQQVWKVLEKSGTPTCLTRNVVMFHVMNFPGYVTIIDHFKYFEVHVQTLSVKVFQLWKVVQLSVFRGLSKASEVLGYSGNAPQPAILCPGHPSTPHPATVDNEGVWICSEHNQSYGIVDQEAIPWLRVSTESPDQFTTSSGQAQSNTSKKLGLQPTLLQLSLLKSSSGNRLEIIKAIAPKWKGFGVYFDFDEQGHTLDIIDKKHSHDPIMCCTEMMQKWLEGRSRQPSTWATLIELLKNAEYNDLARKLEVMMSAVIKD